MKPRVLVAFIILLLGILVSGCWDSIEIQKRAFIIGVGVDAISAGPSPQDKFLVSVEIPKLASAAQGQSGEVPGAYLLQATGSTVFTALRHMAARSNLSLFFGHMRLLVIGEEAARRGLENILDVWERGTEASRRFRVVVANGEAREVLSVAAPTTEVTSLFIYDVMDNTTKTSHFITGSTYGGILMALHETGNVLLPRVTPGKEDVVVAGSGIIKDWKLVGWLDEVETRAVGLILGYIRGGTIDLIDYPNDANRVTLEILNASRQLRPRITGDEVTVDIRVNVQVRVAEAEVEEQVADQEYLQKAEALAAEQLKEDIEKVIAKLQKEFQADVIGLGWLIQRDMTKDWQHLKDNWSEIFSRAKTNVEVTVRIREIGMVG